MSRPQLVDPLEDLGQARDDQGELELGDLDEAVLVLLHVAPGVVRLWACSTWQLILKPGHKFMRLIDVVRMKFLIMMTTIVDEDCNEDDEDNDDCDNDDDLKFKF